jgi:hypothetical protein
MPALNRRESLKLLLGGLLQTAGTVVLAGVVLPARAGQDNSRSTGEDSVKDLQERADRLADAQGTMPGEEGCDPAEFVNGGFRNAAFRNTASGGAAAFRNAATGGGAAGAFRNAATGGGGAEFRNGGFANGGGGGAAFHNGGFANGGWRN